VCDDVCVCEQFVLWWQRFACRSRTGSGIKSGLHQGERLQSPIARLWLPLPINPSVS
uniref:Uncharacterized protein n=1 Tax=Cyprinus carpio TaxID=7962 RepID=A0A8C2G2R9_CYPCA